MVFGAFRLMMCSDARSLLMLEVLVVTTLIMSALFLCGMIYILYGPGPRS